MKKICVVTGTRAEYGLLRLVMEGIRHSSVLDLQVIATGMHLSPEFGLTVEEIEGDGFQITRKIETLLSSDTAVGITKSMGLGIIGFADALAELKPDFMVLLGDRYELLSAAAAAMVAHIPIVHLHGGELTEGSIDDAIRHSITKMSYLHFVATEEYRRRVIQLGEQPARVFKVGGLGVDSIRRRILLTREELEASLHFTLRPRNLVVTFHPATLDYSKSTKQMNELLKALARLNDVGLIFTMPNADTGGRILFQLISDFCAAHPHARYYVSLGQLYYLSCIRHSDGVVGNSSSGLTEAPSFKVGTINIGDRQRGRVRATSVIDCEPEVNSILSALDQLFSTVFKNKLRETKNPYGEGGASKKIVDILEKVQRKKSLKKSFNDL